MGGRDHSVPCSRCGVDRGGLDDLECRCDRLEKAAEQLDEALEFRREERSHGITANQELIDAKIDAAIKAYRAAKNEPLAVNPKGCDCPSPRRRYPDHVCLDD